MLIDPEENAELEARAIAGSEPAVQRDAIAEDTAMKLKESEAEIARLRRELQGLYSRMDNRDRDAELRRKRDRAREQSISQSVEFAKAVQRIAVFLGQQCGFPRHGEWRVIGSVVDVDGNIICMRKDGDYLGIAPQTMLDAVRIHFRVNHGPSHDRLGDDPRFEAQLLGWLLAARTDDAP